MAIFSMTSTFYHNHTNRFGDDVCDDAELSVRYIVLIVIGELHHPVVELVHMHRPTCYHILVR